MEEVEEGEKDESVTREAARHLGEKLGLNWSRQ